MSRYLLFGRRRGPRRNLDPRLDYYVDLPTDNALLAACLLLGLSLLDALLSLRLFELGAGHEANPFLGWTLTRGIVFFLSAKLSLTILATFVLVLHWNFSLFGRIKLNTLARLLVAVYLGLIVYEVALLIR